MGEPLRRADAPGNPNRILYWLGGLLALLAAGVAALIALALQPRDSDRTPIAGPERTLIWIYDAERPDAGAVAAVVEESRDRGTLRVVAFPVPPDLVQVHAGAGARRAWEELERSLGRRVDHAIFLPAGVIARLIDASGGIALGNRSLTGAEAVAYLLAGEDQPRRAVEVFLALAEAATARGVNLGIQDAMALAGQVETDLDLLSLPAVLSRWSGYPAPQVETLATGDLAAVRDRLLPDAGGRG